MAWWWALECLGVLAEPGFSWAEQGGAVALSARASLCGGAAGVVAEPWRREVMRCRSRTEVLSPQAWEGDGPQGRRVAGAASHFLPNLACRQRKSLRNVETTPISQHAK